MQTNASDRLCARLVTSLLPTRALAAVSPILMAPLATNQFARLLDELPLGMQENLPSKEDAATVAVRTPEYTARVMQRGAREREQQAAVEVNHLQVVRWQMVFPINGCFTDYGYAQSNCVLALGGPTWGRLTARQKVPR